MKKYILLFLGILGICVFSVKPQLPDNSPPPPQECKKLTIRNDFETKIYCCFYNKDSSLITETEEIAPHRRITIIKKSGEWKNVATVSIFQTSNNKKIKDSPLSSENSLITFTEDGKIEIR